MLRQSQAANGRHGHTALRRPGLVGRLDQRGVAQLTRRILRALARRVARIHAADLQGDGMLRTGFFTLEHKGIGGRLQTVVHMDGDDLARPALGAGQQQRSGVRSAAEGNGQRQRWCKALDGSTQGGA